MSKSLVILYRFSNVLHQKNFIFLAKIITYFIRLIAGAWIPASVQIGRDIVFGYGGLGIVIHDRAVLGDNCHIDQGVTIGGTSKKYEVPYLGNNVYVGAGAKILGPVTIGNDVVIGANAVVVKDIPDHSLVVGIPGKVIKTNIRKEDYV